MKTHKEQVKDTEEEFGLKLRKRESQSVTLSIPIEVLRSLEKVATSRDMSREALLKFYIGQGLRQDLAKRHAERVMETTADVLERHQYSKEEVSTILKEIQMEAML